MSNVQLKFEALGYPLTSATLSVVTLPSLVELSAIDLSDLPELGESDGYFFPSAVSAQGAEDVSGASMVLPPAPSGFFWFERSRFPRYFHDLSHTYEDFFANKSAKTRSTLRRKLRKFEKESDGAIDWRIFRNSEEMEEFHSLATKLAKKTYQARLYDAALPEGSSFVEEMRRLAEVGQVAGFLLFLKKEVVAYLYTPIKDGRVIYGFLGFDTKFRELSPGTVLQLLALRWCLENKELTLFDFTEGEGAHKSLFSTHRELCVDLLLLKERPSLVLLTAIYRVSSSFSKFIGNLLDRLGLKSRIKGWLRRTH